MSRTRYRRLSFLRILSNPRPCTKSYSTNSEPKFTASRKSLWRGRTKLPEDKRWDLSVSVYQYLLTVLVQALIRDLEHSVRVLSDQVKFLTMNAPPSVPGPHVQQLQHSNSPGASGQLHQGSPMTQSHLRQAPVTQGPANYGQGHPPYQQQQQSPPSSMQGPWYSTSIAAPQASHPLAPPPPPPPPPQTQRSPPAQSQHEEWDDTYLAVLGTQDPRQLRELLSRSNPEVVMPLNGTGPLSQAVVLTLLHRVCVPGSSQSLNTYHFPSARWRCR